MFVQVTAKNVGGVFFETQCSHTYLLVTQVMSLPNYHVSVDGNGKTAKIISLKLQFT